MAQTAANLSGIVINEIGAAPNSVGGIGPLSPDINGDGGVTASDEFIELYNSGSSAIDIQGWEIWEDGVRSHVVQDSTVLQPGDFFVLVDSEAGTGAGFGIQNVNGAEAEFSTVQLGLTSTSVILLYDPDADAYVVVAGNDATFSDPNAITDAIGALEALHPDAQQVGPTETAADDSPGNSMQRDEDGDDLWVATAFNPGAPNCFAAGTSITTADGTCAVEHLVPGDWVQTADGRTVPVRFVFRQTVAMDVPVPERLAPVRIRAGALGDGLPRRDLVVTADHGLVIGDCLVNAGALVGFEGVGFVGPLALPQAMVFYHVETEAHEALLAEGVPAESFVDAAGRDAFDNHGEYLALYGAERLIPEMACLRVGSARLLPAKVRAALLAGGAEEPRQAG